jgi:hypothetical protein
MREIRQSGSEGGVALTPPSLPLSKPGGQPLPLDPPEARDGLWSMATIWFRTELERLSFWSAAVLLFTRIVGGGGTRIIGLTTSAQL